MRFEKVVQYLVLKSSFCVDFLRFSLIFVPEKCFVLIDLGTNFETCFSALGLSLKKAKNWHMKTVTFIDIRKEKRSKHVANREREQLQGIS